MEYDVIVCGAGPTGSAAAIAAGRAGARVLLLERYGFAGGMATAALVNPFSGHEFSHPETRQAGSLIGGIFREIVGLLSESGGYGSVLTRTAFDEERLKCIYDDLIQAAGVDVLYHTTVVGVERIGDRIKALRTMSKDGPEKHAARIIVDSTGDGDIAALSGCEWSLGRAADHLTQAMTTKFRVGNVDTEAMVKDVAKVREHDDKRVELHKKARLLVEPYFQRAIHEDRLRFPYREWIHFYGYPRSGILHFNMTRINRVSGLSAKDLTHAEIEGRRQAVTLTDWLVEEVPYFRNAYLEKLAFHVGVRETRHVEGLYRMTRGDIVGASKFEDAIVRSAYSIDIHSPTGSGFDHEVEGGYGAFKQEYRVPEGEYYEVPYRSIVPKGIDNLIVACRALSATHEASAAIRVMATMTGIGEAAGVAAARAALDGRSPQEVDGKRLRHSLGYLDQEPEFGGPWDRR